MTMNATSCDRTGLIVQCVGGARELRLVGSSVAGTWNGTQLSGVTTSTYNVFTPPEGQQVGVGSLVATHTFTATRPMKRSFFRHDSVWSSTHDCVQVSLARTRSCADDGDCRRGPASAPCFVRPLDNGYMTGAAGASFSDTQAATFGIEIGETINPRVQAYVAFNYFDDLFNDQAASDLNDLANYLTAIHGEPWEFHGRDRGLAFSGGARYLLSHGPSFRPYVGGGPGILNIQRSINERTLGDVSDPLLVVFGAPDGFIDAREQSTFRPMAEFIAGVGNRLRTDLRGRGIPLEESLPRRILHVLAVHGRRRNEVLTLLSATLRALEDVMSIARALALVGIAIALAACSSAPTRASARPGRHQRNGAAPNWSSASTR
jgi:hypothetical protein